MIRRTPYVGKLGDGKRDAFRASMPRDGRHQRLQDVLLILAILACIFVAALLPQIVSILRPECITDAECEASAPAGPTLGR